MKRWQIILLVLIAIFIFMRMQKPKTANHEECCGMKPPV